MNGLLLLFVHSLCHLGEGVAAIQTTNAMRVLVGAAEVRVLVRARPHVKLQLMLPRLGRKVTALGARQLLLGSGAASPAEANATCCACVRAHWIR